MAVVLDGRGSGSTSPWLYGPKPSVKEAAPQWLWQDWPGSLVANLVNQRGAQAGQHCMPLGFLQTVTLATSQRLQKLLFIEGDRRIIKPYLQAR